MNNRYISPFSTRYASDEMQYLFSDEFKFKTWRKLWVALAKAEKELGLNISEEQVKELEAFQNDINFEQAKEIEKEVRHDVMSHVKAYGLQCENAKGIIHLGATSCYVGDNTDIIIMEKGLKLIRDKILSVMINLKEFAIEYKSLPTLGFTHFQPAQLVTVGKRATLWLHDLLLDIEELEHVLDSLKLRGVKGTTGTQASYLNLFNNDHDKVRQLEKLVEQQFGFKDSYPVTGQTYSRKVDSKVINLLSQIAQSSYKFANDLRLLQSMKEIEEPFESKQIGSSAMAYKRNPMRSERMCALARYVIADALNPAMTASTQWLERTLDDSANRRLSVSEGFLAIDAILNIYINVTSNLAVYPKVILKHVNEELPFMATENIMMEAAKKGVDRQVAHERIREYSMIAANNVKQEGLGNNLIELIASDPLFMMTKEEIDLILKPENFIGRCKEQVEEFIENHVNAVITKYKGSKSEIELKV
ncbi:MAG: adenylosuccinate lyase [Clostridia bacterium]|nr:adenylosuccinate lyase [Clostridia bacterium]